MAKETHRKLQEHLHRLPMGFPPTESGVEIKLLRKLFEEEEAGIALKLTPEPEAPAVIAQRLDQDPDALADKLERMAKKGLIMRKRRNGEALYNLEPWIVGIYEYQVAHLDREFVDLSEQYGEEGYGDEFFGSETPYWRVLPVEKSIPTGLVIFPYEKVSEIIERSDTIGVTTCICRTKEKMLGRGCDHATDNCMIFGSQFEFYLENGWPGRPISKKEAYEILDQAEEEGLVHCSQNAATDQWFICNCCSCCCGSIKEVNELGLHSLIARTSYYADVDEEICAACEDCVERCPYGATSVEDDIARVNRERCMGCGLCVSTCTTEALSLVLKPEDEITVPAESLEVLNNLIATEKGREIKITVE